LFIPYDNGHFLVADRQNTFQDAFKTETRKLHLQSGNGPAIGASGYTEIIQKLYSELRQTGLTAGQNVCEQIRKTLAPIIAKTSENAPKGTARPKLNLKTFKARKT
jgi:hypothetical protein